MLKNLIKFHARGNKISEATSFPFTHIILQLRWYTRNWMEWRSSTRLVRPKHNTKESEVQDCNF